MLGLLNGLLGLAWKVLSFALVINIFLALIRSGKDTIRDLLDTLVMAIKVGTKKLQGWLFEKYKGA